MEKQKKGQRDIKEILLKVFPDIDVKALDEILNRPDEAAPSTSAKTKDIEEFLNTQTSAFDFDSSKTSSNFFKDKETLNLDEQFNKRQQKYLKAVKKSVTTQVLPTISKISMPTFLKNNIKSIATIMAGNPSFLNKIKMSSFSKNDTIFNLMINGSNDSDYVYDLAVKRFSNLSNSPKFIFSYISPNNEEDKTNNYRNKKDIVINEIANKMKNLDVDRFFFFNEEKNYKNGIHPIQQIESLSEKHNVAYMICGFNALKGAKGDNKELDKALSLMLKRSKVPFIIMKESVFLNPDSTIDGFKWLFIFDKVNPKCFNTFKKFSPLIDFTRDTVCALTLLPANNPQDDIETLFMKEVQNRGCNKFQYEHQKYDGETHVLIKNKVHFGNIVYNFVVIYNNTTPGDLNQLLIEKLVVSNTAVINNVSSNICLLNGN